jgi:hypothetical protein
MAQQFTLTDIDVGVRLVEALAKHAVEKGGAPIGYRDLVTLARSLHPKDAVLGRAVAVGIGMKLRFVADFCAAQGYPNLACLVPGPSAAVAEEAERRAAAGFDWPQAQGSLAEYAAAMRSAVPKRLKPRKERPADVAWYAYFCSHRAACATLSGDDKKEIINLLMAGLDPETALLRVMAAKAEYGDAV